MHFRAYSVEAKWGGPIVTSLVFPTRLDSKVKKRNFFLLDE